MTETFSFGKKKLKRTFKDIVQGKNKEKLLFFNVKLNKAKSCLMTIWSTSSIFMFEEGDTSVLTVLTH